MRDDKLVTGAVLNESNLIRPEAHLLMEKRGEHLVETEWGRESVAISANLCSGAMRAR